MQPFLKELNQILYLDIVTISLSFLYNYEAGIAEASIKWKFNLHYQSRNPVLTMGVSILVVNKIM